MKISEMILHIEGLRADLKILDNKRDYYRDINNTVFEETQQRYEEKNTTLIYLLQLDVKTKLD